MEAITIVLIISAIIATIGFITANQAHSSSGLEFFGGILAIAGIVTLFFFTIPYSSSSIKRTEYTYLTPDTITKTIDGFTVASYQNKALTSDKAIVYLAPETNVFIEVANKYNHWNIKLTSTESIVAGKPNECN